MQPLQTLSLASMLLFLLLTVFCHVCDTPGKKKRKGNLLLWKCKRVNHVNHAHVCYFGVNIV